MTTISPGDATALVQLRALLEHARRATATTSPVGQLTALVLLDAVNERVTHLAAQTLPEVRVGARDPFEDSHSKVKTALAGAWARDNGWAEVRKLHRARNAAQHEGLNADPALLSGWTVATERYTDSLVMAVFGIPVGQVHLADAIVDAVLAAKMRHAEEALDRGDIASTMTAVNQAFHSAYRSWLQQHNRAHEDPFSPSLSHGFSEFREIGRALDNARDLVVAQAFAMDPAEYTWYSYLRKADSDSITSEEARRALTFVFWWLVRWEAVGPSMLPMYIRRHRSMRQRRQSKVRTNQGPARLVSVAVRTSTPGRRIVTFGLVDLPTEDIYNDWRSAVVEGLRSVAKGQYRFVTLDVDSIVLEVTDDVASASLIRQVRDVLHDAEQEVIEVVDARRKDQIRVEAARADFATELAQSADSVPVWVDSVFLDEAVEIVGDVESSRLRITLADSSAQHALTLSEIIRGHSLVDAVSIEANNSLRVRPQLTATETLAVLWDIDPEVFEHLRAEQKRREREEQVSADLLGRLRASLNASDGIA